MIFLQITEINLFGNEKLWFFGILNGFNFSIGLTPYAGIVRPFRAFGFSECPLTPTSTTLSDRSLSLGRGSYRVLVWGRFHPTTLREPQ